MELAKEWRTDRVLRHLQALLLVADKERMFLVSGNGDLIEPDDAIAAIGSGGPIALAAAQALVRHLRPVGHGDCRGSPEDCRRHLHLH